MNIKRILIIGGDSRMKYLEQALSEDGYITRTYAEEEPLKNAVVVLEI